MLKKKDLRFYRHRWFRLQIVATIDIIDTIDNLYHT